LRKLVGRKMDTQQYVHLFIPITITHSSYTTPFL
jgi:hypothetical protein